MHNPYLRLLTSLGNINRRLIQYHQHMISKGARGTASYLDYQRRNVDAFTEGLNNIIGRDRHILETAVQETMEYASQKGQDLALAELNAVSSFVQRRPGGSPGVSHAQAAGALWMNASTRRLLGANPGWGLEDVMSFQAMQTLDEMFKRVASSSIQAFTRYSHEMSQFVGLGVLTRRDASLVMAKTLAKDGIKVFTDKAGRAWNLESYSEMAVRTMTAEAALYGHLSVIQGAGVNLVRIIPGPYPCPTCDAWAGKPLAISYQAPRTSPEGTPYDTIELARAEGWGHPNCRCTTGIYLEGVTDLNTNRPDADLYLEDQRQREIERKIREWKDRAAGAPTAEFKAEAEAKVREWQATMRGHLKDNPQLLRKYYREGGLPTERGVVHWENRLADVTKLEEIHRTVSSVNWSKAAEKWGAFHHRGPRDTSWADWAFEVQGYKRRPKWGTDHLQEAVSLYQGMFYGDINSALRDGSELNSTAETILAGFETLFAEAAENSWGAAVTSDNMVTYRGLRTNPYGNVRVGEVITEKAYLSTSANFYTAQRFSHQANGVILEIRTPAGTPVIPMDQIQGRNQEYEFVWDKGSEYRVVEKKWVDYQGNVTPSRPKNDISAPYIVLEQV